MLYTLEVRTGLRVEFIDVTSRVQTLIEEKGVKTL